jgi:hypothetical protein
MKFNKKGIPFIKHIIHQILFLVYVILNSEYIIFKNIYTQQNHNSAPKVIINTYIVK